jgi:hypothetical protein
MMLLRHGVLLLAIGAAVVAILAVMIGAAWIAAIGIVFAVLLVLAFFGMREGD